MVYFQRYVSVPASFALPGAKAIQHITTVDGEERVAPILIYRLICNGPFFDVLQTTEVYRQPNLSPVVDRGGLVGVMTSGASVQAASASVDVRLRAGRSLRRSDFRAIASMRAGGPTPRKSRARPARISPAVRVPGDRHGAGVTRPGVRAGSA